MATMDVEGKMGDASSVSKGGASVNEPAVGVPVPLGAAPAVAANQAVLLAVASRLKEYGANAYSQVRIRSTHQLQTHT